MARAVENLRPLPPPTGRASALSVDDLLLAVESESDVDELRSLGRELAARASQLEGALQSRILIEQAKGILAERLGLSLDEAFDALRGAARSSRVRIHLLAGAVVASPETPVEIARKLTARAS